MVASNEIHTFSMSSRSERIAKGTKLWLIRNLGYMLAVSGVAFVLLCVSFEFKMHKHTKASKTEMELRHKLSELRMSVSTFVKREVAHKRKVNVFNWKPIEDECSANGLSLDPFPANFDLELYEEIYGEGSDYHHYLEIGRSEGFECTRGQRLKEIINMEILPKFIHADKRDEGMILEIGPFLGPMLIDNSEEGKVKYFDVMNLEGLKERAQAVGYPEIHPVEIDYVSPTGDLSIIPEKNAFSLVASSNTVSHQTSLVRHLSQVAELLKEGGYYALNIPDKRYMFDHFLEETSISEVLEDHYDSDKAKAGFHKMRSIIEHRALTTHSDVARHWRGASGTAYKEDLIGKLKGAVEEFQAGERDGKYVDVHNYKFTPQGFALIADTLYNLGLSDLRVHRVYETMNGRFEFGIVLKKCIRSRVAPGTTILSQV